jgi:hypothetical protein
MGDKGAMMRNAIRAGTMVAMVLAAMAGIPGARADDSSPASASEPMPAEQQPVEPGKQVIEPGAASVEPRRAIDEDGAAAGHQAWVDSIHASP